MSTASNDSDTVLPRQVRAQVEAGKRILEARRAPPPQPAGTASATAPAPASAGGENGNSGAPNSQAAAPSPGSAPASAPAASDPRESDPAYWRQRWSVTDGLLKAAQKQRTEEREAREQTIAELRKEIAQLKSQSSAPSGGPDISGVFTPEQIEALGEDQCRAILTGAQSVAKKEVESLLAEHIKPAQSQTESQRATAAQQAEDAFFDKLTELCPSWEELNGRTPAFLEWLAEADVHTGLVRDEVLKTHRNRLNAAGAAKVFNDFLASRQRPQPPVAAPAQATPAAPAPAAPAQGAPTPEEMKDYFKRSKLGKVTAAERTAFEARLQSMQRAA